MGTLIGNSGRLYAPLPINGDRGFPQAFPVVFGGVTYRFLLYVNAPAPLLVDKTAILDLQASVPAPLKVAAIPVDFSLPAQEAFLVVRVDQDLADGTSRLLFLRKVVPGLEYEAGAIALTFPSQRVAVSNLNGQGVFGSQVTGGIAPRWA